MRALVLLALVGCGIPGYPVSPRIAAVSTFEAHGAVEGQAFIVSTDGGVTVLVTVRAVCEGRTSVRLGVGTVAQVAARSDRLCLLLSPAKLGPALRISRRRPFGPSHPKFHAGPSGSPRIVVGMWGQDYGGGGSYGYGVDGVNDGAHPVSLAHLRGFLVAAGVKPWQEPCCGDEDIGRLGHTPDRHTEQETGTALDPALTYEGQ